MTMVPRLRITRDATIFADAGFELVVPFVMTVCRKIIEGCYFVVRSAMAGAIFLSLGPAVVLAGQQSGCKDVGACERHIARVSSRAVTPTPDHSGNRQAPRVVLSLNGGYQTSQFSFKDDVVFKKNLEEGHIVTDYQVPMEPGFDASVGVRVTQYFGVGGGISHFYHADVARRTVSSVPHPFYFKRDRSVKGSAPSARQELLVHLQGMLFAPVSDRILVTVFGGPSSVKLRQQLISKINYQEAYPYNTVVFTKANVVTQTATGWGGHVGVDVVVSLSDHVGLGGIMRYTRATAELRSPDKATFSVKAGGLQVGGGLRLSF